MRVKEIKTREINISLTIDEAVKIFHELNKRADKSDIELGLLDELSELLTRRDLGI